MARITNNIQRRFCWYWAEVTEQAEFGAFQKVGDKSTKKQGAV